MHMRRVASLACLLWTCALPLVATAPVPRKSPELKYLDPSDKERLLTSFTGKVVVIEFMLVKCPHCLRIALTLDKLNGELGRRGFQPICVAFDNGINGAAVTNFERQFKLTYPVGYTTSDKVDSYLGRTETERLQVPQLVVIDRAGVIRAQSLPIRETNLESENYLRNLIDGLLKEGAPAPSGTKHAAGAPKKVS